MLFQNFAHPPGSVIHIFFRTSLSSSEGKKFVPEVICSSHSFRTRNRAALPQQSIPGVVPPRRRGQLPGTLVVPLRGRFDLLHAREPSSPQPGSLHASSLLQSKVSSFLHPLSSLGHYRVRCPIFDRCNCTVGILLRVCSLPLVVFVVDWLASSRLADNCTLIRHEERKDRRSK